MGVNKLCSQCGYLNWATRPHCDRCRASLAEAPCWEYPPASQPEPSSWFCGIIDSAACGPAKLRGMLLSLSEQQIYEFQSEFLQAAAELRDTPFTDHMEGSEDGVEDISWWVVSRGSDYYRRVWANPRLLPYHAEDVPAGETLVSVAGDVYEERFGLPLNLL